MVSYFVYIFISVERKVRAIIERVRGDGEQFQLYENVSKNVRQKGTDCTNADFPK